MKVSKPKENQLLFEDDMFKQFDTEVKSKTGLVNSPINELYESFILFYRFKDMDASKQIFYGNKLSLMTSIASMLDRLINESDFTIKDIEKIVAMVKFSNEHEKK